MTFYQCPWEVCCTYPWTWTHEGRPWTWDSGKWSTYGTFNDKCDFTFPPFFHLMVEVSLTTAFSFWWRDGPFSRCAPIK